MFGKYRTNDAKPSKLYMPDYKKKMFFFLFKNIRYKASKFNYLFPFFIDKILLEPVNAI